MELLNLPTETLENIVHDAFGERADEGCGSEASQQ
jgi:hypothetical protein